ncbi:probable very-long-chain enoyl-CoA reductase art-1 [Hydractinia symbiolongicarpus]|uniref:probable very-long-chain enoyl-CoA reductase art-1 n=1 Tax=Hydractinia symbiolongicarpus TaxID=13093 RepID=UPI00254EB636|nr:probable very-long-chain enoyl-CoA reductase art-1 [Hydractinia symbiolongicarpus]
MSANYRSFLCCLQARTNKVHSAENRKMKVEIISARTKEVLHTLEDASIYTTIEEIKIAYEKVKPKLYPSRQAYRKEPRGKILSNDATLRSLEFDNTARLYFKDLGPQIGWKTVFLTEYAGPFFLYPLFYARPSFIYGSGASAKAIHPYVHIACACYVFHYGKRLAETHFIHRFSNGTMPIMNLFKNSIYYWGFTCFIAYFINHPLYTPASFGDLQVYASLAGFIFCQLGNYSIHVALRNLRPEGTKERKIPMPTSNPFTWLLNLVSCPNYTYEIGSWFWFTVLTQTVMSGVFTFAGCFQMVLWAIKKHKNYRREFKDYPRKRKAIIPFVI